MKAIHVVTESEGRPLVWAEAEDPLPGPDDVLVENHATSVNRADLAQRAGHYPPPPGASHILGLDMAGRIIEVGENVSGWKVGDRVCALIPGGGYAERVAVPYHLLMPIPEGWSYEQGAAIPEVFLTAFVNVFMEAGFTPGESVLFHGGGSGVGTAAIQLVRQAGGRMIVTAGKAEKIQKCLELGAHLAINYRQEDFVQRVREYTGGAGVDVIIDMVGADYLERNLSLLKPKGRLVYIATLSGSRAEIDLRALMGRRLRIIGSVLRGRAVEEKIEITRRFMARFWPLLEKGDIRPVIDSVFPIESASQAHQYLAEYRNVGKVILKIR
ncbi:MAG: NAD(P)H-quinone oxidoreductase [Anaerolineae bacterium]